MDLAELRAEIEADPEGLGLAPLLAAGEDWKIARELNAPRASVRLAATVRFADLLRLAQPDELPKADSAERTYLDMLAAIPRVLLDAGELARLAAVVGPNTHAAIVAASERDGSRAEALWGSGTDVAVGDVSACLEAERKAVYDAEQAGLDTFKADLDAALVAHRAAATEDREAARAGIEAAQAALKAEYEKRGAVFGANEEPSVLVLP